MGRRIAMVDCLFRWPPDGGARVEVVRILEFLSGRADVRLFCPRVEGDPAGRGVIEGLPEVLRAKVQAVDASRKEFVSGRLRDRMVSEVERFSPDKVLVGDAWHYKPHFIGAFAKYRPAVRFFAHEGICLKGHGHRFRDGAPCDYCYLDKGAGFERCRSCACDWKSKAKTNVFDLEWGAAGFPGAAGYESTMRSALASTSLVMTCNRREMKRLAPYCRKAVVSRCGVEPTWLKNPRTGAFPLSADGTWRLMMTGRCDDFLKGLHLLVEACAALHGRGIRNFELVYTGLARKHWEKFPWLKPLGWLPRERLAAELVASDLTIHPSLWPEPFGIAALESITKGVPALVAGHGGLGDLVAATGGGWEFQPGDPAALSDALERLLKSPELLRTASASGVAHGSEWLWESVLMESCAGEELLGVRRD